MLNLQDIRDSCRWIREQHTLASCILSPEEIGVVAREGTLMEDGALRKLLCMGAPAISERQGRTLQLPPESIYTTDMSCHLTPSWWNVTTSGEECKAESSSL